MFMECIQIKGWHRDYYHMVNGVLVLHRKYARLVCVTKNNEYIVF